MLYHLTWIVVLTFLAPGQARKPAPATAAPPPTTRPAAAEYSTRPDHDPDGIGKFYMGREIAKVMGHEAARWLERPEREQQEQGVRMLSMLKVRPGEVVADIGAGSGHYSFRLARMVGPQGRVKAVDIQQEMLDLIRKRQRRERVANIDLVLGSADNPNLEPESLDLVLMVDVYHEFDMPFEMMQHIVAALKPGGRVVFVEFKLEDPKIPIKLLHKMSVAQVRKEMELFPVKHKETVSTLPWQHVITFEKLPPATQPAN
jgi:ubiquinone/menaquinone biosynthesis C-methylase UbiE